MATLGGDWVVLLSSLCRDSTLEEARGQADVAFSPTLISHQAANCPPLLSDNHSSFSSQVLGFGRFHL